MQVHTILHFKELHFLSHKKYSCRTKITYVQFNYIYKENILERFPLGEKVI